MGLDQYLRRSKTESFSRNILGTEDVEYVDIKVHKEIAYWRKHSSLQGYMEKLYIKRGGTGDFNCENLILTAEDIAELIKTIEAGQLPETSGFFFGDGRDNYYYDYDLKTFQDALTLIQEGYTITYSSWW